jgi:hypothetical protein
MKEILNSTRTIYHTSGYKESQIKEVLASSALVRKWSTMLNGDHRKFQQQVDAIFASH